MCSAMLQPLDLMLPVSLDLQLLRTEWLDELRQAYGHPWAADATDAPNVTGHPEIPSQPPDAAALAASLAARLQASAPQPPVPPR